MRSTPPELNGPPVRLHPGPGGPPHSQVSDIQRTRILQGAIEAVAQSGYCKLTVSQVIDRAGVSRRTFYELFHDRGDCLLAAHRKLHRELHATLAQSLKRKDPEESLPTVVGAIADFAQHDRRGASFLMWEIFSGGPQALRQRDGSLTEIEALLEEARARASPRTSLPDLPSPVLVGALQRVFGASLSQKEEITAKSAAELIAWIGCYGSPWCEHRWRERDIWQGHLKPLVARANEPVKFSRADPIERRQRIMSAAAAIARERGYAAVTIGEISSVAGVDRRALQSLFAEKQDVFVAIQDSGFHEGVTLVLDAYFSAASWPRRIWEALCALASYLEEHPDFTLTHFVECYAIGFAALQRVSDGCAAFMVLLSEGRRYSNGEPLGQLSLRAIGAMIFEILYRRAHTHRLDGMREIVPDLAHLCLVPFMGIAASERFIEHRLGET